MISNQNELGKAIHECMNERGITDSEYRVAVTEVDRINGDYANVTVEIKFPHKRKVGQIWNLKIDIVREIIFWDHSTFYYL